MAKKVVEARVSRDIVGKVEVILYKKDGSVLANVFCASGEDALELLSGLLGLTASK